LGELSSDSETKGGNTLIHHTFILPQSPGIDKNNAASYNFSIRSYNWRKWVTTGEYDR